MTGPEIIERLRALKALPPDARPIPILQLEQLAGLARGTVEKILHGSGNLMEKTRVRLERALSWVENDQVRVRRGGYRNSANEYTIAAPNPPQVNVTTVKFTSRGPRISLTPYNPRALKPVGK